MTLPIDAVLPELLAALAAHPSAVLVAPPGAGKSTRAPLALLDASWAAGKKILLLSPRRVAARAAAARMASMLGEPVGETVGYRVRLESRVSRRTRLEVITEGVFTRMILADPALDGSAAVLFDEFHERSLEGDLGLALALDAQGALREDMRLVVMSATLDGARVAGLLGDAPLIVSEGRMHPVSERYLGRDARAPIEQQMADAVRNALAAEAGSLLCFLPGAREIERTAERLRDSIRDPAVSVHTLYGALDPRAQDAAIAPAETGKRKIVLATPIAETSLTIEGVRVVIDSGLSRRPRFEPGLGLTRLETVRVSRASAEQRKGRAGRVEPGACWRLWDEAETRALVAFDRPEILEADLAGLALDLAAWGVSDPAQLKWLDAPPAGAWTQSLALLRDLDALDADGRLTPEGRRIADLPLHPRLAHMVTRAAADGAALHGALLAMVLSEQGLGGRDADVRERLRRFRNEGGQRAGAARRVAENLAKRVGGRSDEAVALDRSGALLAAAYPGRIAKARGKRGEFLMANGRAASIEETDALAREPYLAIAEVAGRADRAQILAAAPLAVEDIERMFAERIETVDEVAFDVALNGVRARRVRRYGRLVLSDAPLERAGGEDVRAALLDAVRAHGLGLLSLPEPVAQLRARVALLRRLDGETWPDWSDAALTASADEWLAPLLDGVTRLDALAPDAVRNALAGQLPWDMQRRLDAEAPERFETAAGSSLRIDYEAENGPALDVRLQELFGVDAHPSVAKGRAPLLLRLLSPAHRPVQTTRDLPGFWRGSYAAVRVDMKGRYPKHPWPEDPLSAEPTRRAKPRGS
ncbi:MAG: ATP-dependent helicase HrpB [Hyphomonadaceae bacterium]|nr:MAG: ATP-dependent helicase HrpB [Caulobacteraceae bacterium]MBT9444979.1 ATP-dependent helicase HrpB [Hyphomonadaceae bacterium]